MITDIWMTTKNFSTNLDTYFNSASHASTSPRRLSSEVAVILKNVLQELIATSVLLAIVSMYAFRYQAFAYLASSSTAFSKQTAASSGRPRRKRATPLL